MSAGLRNQRVTVYAPTAALDAGVTSRTYTRLATWWARLEPPTGREVTTGWAPEHRVDAVIVFADEAVVARNDVMVDGAGAVWEVRAVLPRRAHAEQQCLVQWGDQSAAAYLLVES